MSQVLLTLFQASPHACFQIKPTLFLPRDSRRVSGERSWSPSMNIGTQPFFYFIWIYLIFHQFLVLFFLFNWMKIGKQYLTFVLGCKSMNWDYIRAYSCQLYLSPHACSIWHNLYWDLWWHWNLQRSLTLQLPDLYAIYYIYGNSRKNFIATVYGFWKRRLHSMNLNTNLWCYLRCDDFSVDSQTSEIS